VGDNETARLALLQETQLASLLQGLQQSPGGLLGTGYDAEAVAALVQQQLQTVADAGSLEEVEPQLDQAEALRVKWGVEPGQLWQLGRHRVVCGDATDPQDVGYLLGSQVPVLMVTDPPYGVGYDPGWRDEAAERGQLSYAPQRTGEVPNDDRTDWSDAYRLFPGDVLYAWSPGGDLLIASGQALQTAGFQIRNQLIWRKPHFPISRGHYTYQHEPCWYAVRKGGQAHWCGDSTASTVWEIPLDPNVAGGHSTQKPLECMARPIRNHDAPAVYDPFLGSGTTLIACEQLGRTCYGMEIAPQYVAVTLDRWGTLTGQQPQRLG
jgi:DNA modification methylase